MKRIYLVIDDIANDVATCFVANNDQHAKKMFNLACQRESVDSELSLYPVLTFVYNDYTRKLQLGSNKFEPSLLDHFPQKEEQEVSEEKLKEDVSKEE